MSDLKELERLARISSVCAELDQNLGFSDKTLAEFIIHLAISCGDIRTFGVKLRENGADFPEVLNERLFRLIKEMSAGGSSSSSTASQKILNGPRAGEAAPQVMTVPRNANAIAFPGLSGRNTAPVALVLEKPTTSASASGVGASSSSSSSQAREADAKKRPFSDVHINVTTVGVTAGATASAAAGKTQGFESTQPQARARRSRFEDQDQDQDQDQDIRGDSDAVHWGAGTSAHNAYAHTYNPPPPPPKSTDVFENQDRKSRGSTSQDLEPGQGPRATRDKYGGTMHRGQPELYGIYNGKVSNIMDFGCFIELEGFSEKKEGLCHVAQIQKERVVDIKQVVRRGQAVKVKVISLIGSKMALSMKEVDQSSGQDLLPERSSEALRKAAESMSNPTRHAGGAQTGSGSKGITYGVDVNKLRAQEVEEERLAQRRSKKLSSPELWEARQLINAGVLAVSEYPTFDADSGMGALQDVEPDQDIEVEISEEEPPFLRGQTKIGKAAEPVRIVKNPDGSMQRAAMHQAALSKERHEMQKARANDLIDAIPKDLSKPWEDPMPETGERHFASELRSINVGGSFQMPEWKQKTQGKGLSYGFISNKTIREQRESLPVFRFKSALMSAISQNKALVVIGETGSGKTTQMPQYMLEMGYCDRGGIVGCTQPRRVAATSVAKRVAEEHGCELGEEVGYSIRYDDKTSPSTRIKYMTDGMLMREYLADNLLSKYICIIIDEAHERTVNTDVLFGLLKQLLKKRDDFKLIVTSATLNAAKFCEYFQCKDITIPGKPFTVQVMHSKDPVEDYVEATLSAIMDIHLQEAEGDILVFMTGQEEIDTCAEILYSRMKALGDLAPTLHIMPVYSVLPAEMQSRIFDPVPPGERKCVIATNIAEASLTIDGIYYVIDPGFCKQKVFNAKLGMDSLVITPITKASALQRLGRAGRTGPGKCYRLYTQAAFDTEMLASAVPEIQRTNLGNVVLQMKAMGINDLIGFDFMDPPPVQTLICAMESLFAHGALDDEGLLTRLGRKMAEFPLEPPQSKMLIVSTELGCSEEILTIVAMLSVPPVWYRPKEKAAAADQKKAKFNHPDGDHLTMLNVYNAWAASSFSNPWCFDNYIQARAMKAAQDVRTQLISILDKYNMDIVSAGKNLVRVRKCVVAGFFTNCAKKDPQEGYKTLQDGQPVYIHPSSSLFNKNPEWVIYNELVLTTKEYMRNVLAVDAKWLVEMAPKYFKKSDPAHMTKSKRKEKIEPLHDRFNEKDAWRLSKRKF
jgi:ATP-dependent RNA helicase DHX8/PRP22